MRCATCNDVLEYDGRGRPPKYHPACKPKRVDRRPRKTTRRVGRPVEEAFLAQVEVVIEGPYAGCHLWTGNVDRNGYARFYLPGSDNVTVNGHRWAYQHWVGPIPEGKELDHQCHNQALWCRRKPRECLHRRCVNWEHVRPETHSENCRKGDRRGRHVTHCPAQHEYTPENTYVTPDGRRMCRTCQRERDRRRQRK